MKNRFMNVLNGEDGMGTLEYGIIIFIVLMIAVAFFWFRDAVVNLINSATSKVDTIHNNLSNQFDNVSSPIKPGQTY